MPTAVFTPMPENSPTAAPGGTMWPRPVASFAQKPQKKAEMAFVFKKGVGAGIFVFLIGATAHIGLR